MNPLGASFTCRPSTCLLLLQLCVCVKTGRLCLTRGAVTLCVGLNGLDVCEYELRLVPEVAFLAALCDFKDVTSYNITSVSVWCCLWTSADLKLCQAQSAKTVADKEGGKFRCRRERTVRNDIKTAVNLFAAATNLSQSSSRVTVHGFYPTCHCFPSLTADWTDWRNRASCQNWNPGSQAKHIRTKVFLIEGSTKAFFILAAKLKSILAIDDWLWFIHDTGKVFLCNLY